LSARFTRFSVTIVITKAGIDSTRYTLNQFFRPQPKASVTPQQLPSEITISAMKEEAINPIPK